jgi:hypothetical protein
MATPENKNRRLHRKDAFTVAGFLQANRERIKRDKLTANELLIDIRKLPLVGQVHDIHVKSVARDIGVEIHTTFNGNQHKPAGKLRARLERLEKQIAHLYAKLGETIPE